MRSVSKSDKNLQITKIIEPKWKQYENKLQFCVGTDFYFCVSFTKKRKNIQNFLFSLVKFLQKESEKAFHRVILQKLISYFTAWSSYWQILLRSIMWITFCCQYFMNMSLWIEIRKQILSRWNIVLQLRESRRRHLIHNCQPSQWIIQQKYIKRFRLTLSLCQSFFRCYNLVKGKSISYCKMTTFRGSKNTET